MNIENLLSEYDVILASASPRRKELMGLICNDFRVIPSDCGEDIPEDIKPEDTAEYLSQIKCGCIAEVYRNALVIGCDTVVICDGKTLGKPKDEQDAREMLKMLSGKTHQVITGVTISCGNPSCGGKKSSFSVCTDVTFRTLSDEDISGYVQTGEPMDKAGAYGIQGKGALLAEKINGDFYNVVGLPVSELAAKLKEFISNKHN